MELTLYKGRPHDCAGRLEKEVRIYDLLDKLGMEYWRTDHAFMKADTMEDCKVIDDCLGATVCKNLFLCNRQKTNFYLLMMPGDKPFKTKELSHQLLQLFQRGCQPGVFVDTILDYTGYCSREDKERIDEVLKGSAGLDQYEKQKRQGDYLMKNGRYQLAVHEYEKLLSILPEAEKELIPSVYHNLGVACCRLFRFESGASYLKKAYELSLREESGIQYLEALREQLTEADYVSFIADHREYYELSMKVEKLYEMARGQFEATRENRMLSALKIYRDEGNTGSYYEEIDKIIARLKDDYRASVAQ